MFAPLTTEVDNRFAGITSFFTASSHLKGDLAATAKGLAFVQVYAVYEYTVRSAVQIAIESINARNYRLKDLTPSLTALFLDPEFMSLRDAGRGTLWKARLKIFNRIFSNDAATLSNVTTPPHDGTHYRHTNLEMIFLVFGIKRRPTRRRIHMFCIDEVVDNRNQIAHGSETAIEVGRRYTRDDIRKRIRQMQSVCHSLISSFDKFCADPGQHRRS